MKTPLDPQIASAVGFLDMSLVAAKAILTDSPAPIEERLAWLAGELERLAGEAYRIADEASERSSSPPPPDGHTPS